MHPFYGFVTYFNDMFSFLMQIKINKFILEFHDFSLSKNLASRLLKAKKFA